VVYVDGDMVDGESSDIPLVGLHFVGERTISPVLDQLAGNPSVGAIVIRVDSGGGSAMAGELMWRAVARAARRKPVIISMARVAASAAYYISAPAAEIVADPSAITGSIGIFYGKADIAPLLGRIDVGTELLRRGARADMDSMYRGWTADERAVISRLIGEFYNQFLGRVATGRHMTTDAVNAIGEGRVFSASRARGLGLVDRMGGLATALERARHAAGLDDNVDVWELPAEPGGLLSTLASLLGRDGTGTPDAAAQLLVHGPAREALAWLLAVSRLGAGDRPLAMLEWPMLSP
jgi:protease-4